MAEHVFIVELLQEAWFGFGKTVEVLRPEVDNGGYDLALECNGIIRHCQLKNSKEDAKTDEQKVHLALGKRPSGCVIWLFRHEGPGARRLSLSYRFFRKRARRAAPISGWL